MDRTLERYGCPARSVSEYRRFVGNGVRELVVRALPEDRADLVAEVVGTFRALYAEHMCERTRPFPGIPAVLDHLAARGVRLAVLSNKTETATQELVARLFGRWSFVAVLGEHPDRPRKPDPAGALLIAARAGVPPARCVLVGDSSGDVRTAHAAGMRAVGALWGYRDRDEIAAARPHDLVASPAELLAVLAPAG